MRIGDLARVPGLGGPGGRRIPAAPPGAPRLEHAEWCLRLAGAHMMPQHDFADLVWSVDAVRDAYVARLRLELTAECVVRVDYVSYAN